MGVRFSKVSQRVKVIRSYSQVFKIALSAFLHSDKPETTARVSVAPECQQLLDLGGGQALHNSRTYPGIVHSTFNWSAICLK